jgi:hypothetical protein
MHLRPPYLVHEIYKCYYNKNVEFTYKCTNIVKELTAILARISALCLLEWNIRSVHLNFSFLTKTTLVKSITLSFRLSMSNFWNTFSLTLLLNLRDILLASSYLEFLRQTNSNRLPLRGKFWRKTHVCTLHQWNYTTCVVFTVIQLPFRIRIITPYLSRAFVSIAKLFGHIHLQMF